MKRILYSFCLFLFLLGCSMALNTAKAEKVIDRNTFLEHANADVGGNWSAGMCLSYVKAFWVGMGGPESTACCAHKYSLGRIQSTSRDNIPIGADVFLYANSGSRCSTCGSIPGHIGVYVGNGNIVSVLTYRPEGSSPYGKVELISIDKWLSWGYSFAGWGWHDGIRVESGNPHGYLDGAEGGAGRVRVCGWAIDDDAPDQALEIHVYVGGPAGSGEPHGGYYAGNASTDVGNHRFDFSFETNKTGEQPVYVYAINVGAGENIQLNYSPRTVNIASRGSEMTSGYDRTIPDGDYIIAMASNPLFYLDIDGASVPANNGDNVSLCQANTLDGIPDFDAWTVQYRGDGFYSIKQKGTDVSLDIYDASVDESANVSAYASNDSSAQKWAISLNGRNGYRIQAKCSGFSLDANEGISNGANIQQYTSHDGDNQSWVFIPYKPSQPIENGRYIVINAMNQNYELDVYGDSGDIPNETNVQIWNIEALSRYNSFDFVRLSNGYYKVIHAASGKVLDLYNGNTDYVKNISLYDDDFDGNRAHQWAVMERPGGYAIVSRYSGYALDIWGDASDGTNVIQWPYHGLEYQNWIFIPAEYTVSYDANGGEGAPEDQIKYWHTSNVTLSGIVPVREGYTFKYWTSDAENASEGTTIYNPGDVYAEDADLRLYAVWEQAGPRIELSANELILTQYSDAVELKATLHAEATYNSDFVWDCIHVGDSVWDDSLYFRGNNDSAVIKSKERTGNYIITCSTTDGEASASCIVTVEPAPVTGVTLNKTSIVMNVGEEYTLTANITPQYTTLKDVLWSSSNTDVAVVVSGDIYAVGEGTATITCASASDTSIKAICTVKVVVPVNSVTMNRSVYEFGSKSEESTTLAVTVSPENATNKTLTWTSSNTGVATVSDGCVMPVGVGYTRITCESPDGPKGVCDIVVHDDSIIVMPSSLRTIKSRAFYGSSIREVVIPGKTTTIGSKAFANCADLRLVIIPNSVTSIASDAFSGSEEVVFICEAGSTAAEYADSKGIVAVLSSMPESVAIYADTTTVVQGNRLWLGAEVLPSSVTQRVTWSIIEGKDIASIDQTGLLTTQGPGMVTVAATAINGASGTINITVLDKPATFSVMLDPNGGTCDTSYLNARFDEALGTLPVPTRDYYTFNGWYTSASGGTRITESTVYSDYDMGDITLYAHWTEHEWSEWVTEDKLPSGEIIKESKQQYRYQDKVYSSWSDWGPRTETRESTGELKKEQQLTEHYWYYDLCQNCGRHSPYTVCWDCGHNIGANWRVTWLDTSRNEGGQFGNSDKIFTMTEDGRWFYWTDDNGNGDSRIVYQYATRTYTWSDWSEWSDVNVAASTTRNVESRYVYRYKLP